LQRTHRSKSTPPNRAVEMPNADLHLPNARLSVRLSQTNSPLLRDSVTGSCVRNEHRRNSIDYLTPTLTLDSNSTRCEGGFVRCDVGIHLNMTHLSATQGLFSPLRIVYHCCFGASRVEVSQFNRVAINGTRKLYNSSFTPLPFFAPSCNLTSSPLSCSPLFTILVNISYTT
jgi:hypothetical protein